MSMEPYIYSLFDNLYIEWFKNKNYWFEKDYSVDVYLSEKYFIPISKHLLEKDVLRTKSISIQIGAIIAYDQIPRHHNRVHAVDCTYYSTIACEISSAIIEDLSQELTMFPNISAYDWCFIMLPYRHLNNLNKIKKVLKFFFEKYNSESASNSDKLIYKRFLKQTVNKIYKINTLDILSCQSFGFSDVENEDKQWLEYQNILDNLPTSSISFELSKHMNIVKEFKLELDKIPSDANIIVSLSGGVDSCICLYLTKVLSESSSRTITAVHINYNNRVKCKKEVNFLYHFCNILGIPLLTRKICELTRLQCRSSGLRSFYETATKNIRFDMYKQVENKLCNDKATFVLLGHNNDDCFENILMNITAKKNYNNLSGLEKHSVVSDIQLWRPLLNVPKSEIINLANLQNIPYLEDSTPEWSLRYKIRNIILPNLQLINPCIINSYFDLNNHLINNNAIVNDYVLPKLLKSFQHEKDGLVAIFDVDELFPIIKKKNLWREIIVSEKFGQLFKRQHSSHKSIQQFVEFLTRFQQNFHKLQVEKEFKFVMKPDIYAIISRTKTNQINLKFSRKGAKTSVVF